MPSPLNTNLRQAFFVVKQSPETRKISLPKEWNSAVIESPDQILSCIQRALDQNLRLLILVSEQEASQVASLVKLRLQKERTATYGIVVVSKDPLNYLRQGALPFGFLDVLSEKDAKKETEMHLLRTLQHLILSEALRAQKIGPEMLARLNQIFIELSAERNPEKLLGTILLQAITLTESEGGSLYMVEDTDGEMYFRLKISNFQGQEVQFQNAATRAVENSICGYVALTGKSLNIPEISGMRPLTLPQYSRQHDHESQGNLVSMLTIPFKNSRNECVAVIQVVNKKNPVKNMEVPYLSFELEDESILASLGTQAAICMENVDLYGDIQKLFEGFVKASITAIESRDPSTGGHSERVAKMCVALARATSDCDVGIYRSVKFKEEEVRELEYAALLHDFGKIGVREEVLVKAKKLYPYQLEAVQERIKICKAAARISCLEKRLKQGGKDLDFEREYQERVKVVEGYWKIIESANEPAILKQENQDILGRIRHEQLLLPDGVQINLLSEEEYKALAVTQGSLTESERLEIESHVRHTHQFLKMIPWTKDFKHLTEIAYCHHEKLDGSGYPRGLIHHEIPLQSKIMTIADIFDALTAADRWYKEAVPTEKAIEILGSEVADGKIDPVLYEIFVEKKIFEITHPKILVGVA